MEGNEKEIMREIMLAAPAHNSRWFRNNVGTLQDVRGNYIKYGLCTGSSDLIGFTGINITQEMVGRIMAVFTAIEVKRIGWTPPKSGSRLSDWQQQLNFITQVKKFGGIACLATNIEHVNEAISQFKKGN